MSEPADQIAGVVSAAPATSPFERFLDSLPLWPVIAAYVLVALLCAVLVRNALKHWLVKAEPTMAPPVHAMLSRALPRPAGAAVFLFAIGMGMRFFPIPSRLETLTKHVFPFILATLAVTVMMRVAFSAISAYGDTYPQLKSTAGIGRAITWIVGCAIIAVLISDALGVSLAPALTALGVGSLSVALALQDTLSNFFAGVYLLIDRPIRPGEFIRLDGGQEGYVDTIGWRSTRLRTLAPSTVIVPNATLSKAVITNFGATNPRLVLATTIDVALEEDPSKVEAALADDVKGAIEIPGVDRSQSPFLRFALDDRGLAFTLYVTIAPTADGGLVQQELRKRALVRLRRDGIALAPPNPFAKKP
jgi:small-conductance mechanosensitive channel